MRNDFESNYLAHHGILGMKWGQKNGPPYPLAAGAHSPEERRSGYKRSLHGRTNAGLYERNRDVYTKRSQMNTANAKADTVSRPRRAIQRDYSKAKKVERHNKEQKKKIQLSDKQKKALKVGAAVAATALVAYGGYKVHQMNKHYKMGKQLLEARGFKGWNDQRITKDVISDISKDIAKKDYSSIVRNMTDADLEKAFYKQRDKEYSGLRLAKYHAEEMARTFKGDNSLHVYKTSNYMNALGDEHRRRENLKWEMKNLSPEYLAKHVVGPMPASGNSNIAKQYKATAEFGRAKIQADQAAKKADDVLRNIQAQKNAEMAKKLPYRMESAIANKASSALKSKNTNTVREASNLARKVTSEGPKSFASTSQKAVNQVSTNDISRMKSMVSSGKPMTEVAKTLGVSPSTVSKYASDSVKKTTTNVAKQVTETAKPKLTFDTSSSFTKKDIDRLMNNSAYMAKAASTASNQKQLKEIEDYTQELLKKNKKKIG